MDPWIYVKHMVTKTWIKNEQQMTPLETRHRCAFLVQSKYSNCITEEYDDDKEFISSLILVVVTAVCMLFIIGRFV